MRYWSLSATGSSLKVTMRTNREREKQKNRAGCGKSKERLTQSRRSDVSWQAAGLMSELMRPGCWHWSHPGHRRTLPVTGWMCWEVDSHLARPAATHGLTGPNYPRSLTLTSSQNTRSSSSNCFICPASNPNVLNPLLLIGVICVENCEPWFTTSSHNFRSPDRINRLGLPCWC